MKPMDDTAALLEAIGEGSIDALGELYRRYSDAVYATAYRITGSREDAEDVMQDVFVGLARALEAYREQGRFDAWIRRITARTALMRLRSSRRKRETALEEVVPARDAVEGAGESLARMEASAALSRLPEKLRLVFVMKEIEGYSHAEIAALLGITASASGARLSRAWKRLRKELR